MVIYILCIAKYHTFMCRLPGYKWICYVFLFLAIVHLSFGSSYILSTEISKNLELWLQKSNLHCGVYNYICHWDYSINCWCNTFLLWNTLFSSYTMWQQWCIPFLWNNSSNYDLCNCMWDFDVIDTLQNTCGRFDKLTNYSISYTYCATVTCKA